MNKKISLRMGLMGLALPILLFAGCGRAPDERLAEFAQQSMAEQRRQNARLADQSQAVVAESHQLAEAAKELVTRDAQARRELIAGHDRLEQDRRQIAAGRHRDPIIAAVIQNFGLAIACLLPLVVAVLVIRQMQSQEPDHAAVAELLTLELTSKAPRLLSGPRLLPGPRRPELTCDEQAYHEWMTGDPPQASDPTI